MKKFEAGIIAGVVMILIGILALQPGCTSTSVITKNADGTSTTNTVSKFDGKKAANAINISVPGAVRLAVQHEPKAAPYLRTTVTAIRLFTTGSKYDPAALNAAIATAGVKELKTPEVQAAIDAAVGLYKAYYGDVMTQKLSQVDNLLPILNALADSIDQGLTPI